MSTNPRQATPKTRAKPIKHSTKIALGSDITAIPMIADELTEMLRLAFINARRSRHAVITVEHLLYGLAEAIASRDALIACGADVDALKSKLSVFIDENTPTGENQGDVDTQPTLGFQRVIQRAIMQVQSSERSKKQVGTSDVLLSVFGEKDSPAVYCLHQQGVNRLDVMNFIHHGIKRNQDSLQSAAKMAEISDQEKAGREFFSFVSEAASTLVTPSKKESERPKLFISYSHTDAVCLDRLLVHLKPLERLNTVVCWSDKRLRTGDKWRAELENNLNDAVIAILLISADFLASDFIVNNELPPLLVRADANGLRILPVILKPCGFRRDPILSTFQAANDPATPLLGLSAMEQEALYDQIADEVAKEVASKRDA